MITQTNNKPLIVVIVILLLANIAWLVYFIRFSDKPQKKSFHNSAPMGMNEKLKKDVGFTEEQLKQYGVLKTEQGKNIKPLFSEMREAKQLLFKMLSNPATTDSAAIEAAALIGEKQKNIDLQAYYHFKKVRAICTPEQLPKFDSLIEKLPYRMGRGIKTPETPPHSPESDKNSGNKKN